MAIYAYWATFRLERNATYDQRYNAMIAALGTIRKGSWGEPTSFWAFRSEHLIAPVMAALSAPLNAKTDLLLVHAANEAVALFYGQLGSPKEFTEQFPYAKKFG